jgi:hypothetical protein
MFSASGNLKSSPREKRVYAISGDYCPMYHTGGFRFRRLFGCLVATAVPKIIGPSSEAVHAGAWAQLLCATEGGGQFGRPSYSTKKGKTPILSEAEAKKLIQSINTKSIVGLRDRAVISVLLYGFARVGAAVAMSVGDYCYQQERWWFRLHEKGGKHHEMPAHPKAVGRANVGTWPSRCASEIRISHHP